MSSPENFNGDNDFSSSTEISAKSSQVSDQGITPENESQTPEKKKTRAASRRKRTTLSRKTENPRQKGNMPEEADRSLSEAAESADPVTNTVSASEQSPDLEDTASRPKPRSRGRSRKRQKEEKADTDNVSSNEEERIEASIAAPMETAIAISRYPALPPADRPIGREEDVQTKTESRKKTKSPKKQSSTVKQPLKRMFISVLPGEQVEVALTEDGTLVEYYLDMLHQRKIKGNIYKGIIHNIDTNLQAAFVNYGAEKNGFLQIDEIHPEYWQAPHDSMERKFPPIQKVLKTGQEILVQVVKEPAGSKGAFLTTWLSLAGRFLVLTPGQEQIGVSRKVTDHEERARLRELMNGIEPGAGLGVIVRTVGEGATKTTLKTDLQYLKRLWRDIRKKATEVRAPALIHQEPGLSERSVRDYLTDDVSEIWVDNDCEAKNVTSMVSLLFPRKKNLVKLYSDVRQSVWEHFNLESQLEQIYAREVFMPSGGRLVFDQTEALMAIDINSGRISGKGNFEAMAFKTNMEAAEAIARQLRLRDIGGQVVIDFIEMRDKKHVLEVEKNLRQAMKCDRAKHDVARMSSFGLLELVRQRMGSSALSISMETCAACGGTGLRRNLEWQAMQALRDLRHKMKTCSSAKYVYETSRELGMYLLNYKRETLLGIENDFGKTLEIKIQV